MNFKALMFGCLAFILLPASAEARHHSYRYYPTERHHNYFNGYEQHPAEVRYTRVRHQYHHKKYAKHNKRRGKPEVADANGNKIYATIHTAIGLTSTVITSAKDKFQGFINDLERDHRDPETGTLTKGNRITDIGCKSSGHMRNSKHHWGGACDFAQVRRNVTRDKFMYHVTELAVRWGLVDGCTWGHRDCGHIEVPGSNTRYSNSTYRMATR